MVFGGSFINASFSGADLTLSVLSCGGNVDYTGADFTGANLTRTTFLDPRCGSGTGKPTFRRANFTRANLTEANLDGADLGEAILADIISGGITGTPAALPQGWSLVDGTLVYQQP